MTRHEPTLIVRRMIVERESTPVYDENFHTGVNVIRGENSSGKSTILNFLFYGLGGDLADWSAAAKLCSRVVIEVSINGLLTTIRREISEKLGRPMEIYGGDVAASRLAPIDDWKRFPYTKSSNMESFSQALFRLLKIPEVASDISGNVTMNQVLRLLYADQLSPIEDIFRFQRFDEGRLRDTVGRLLCGAYDSSLYDNEQKIKALDKDFDVLSGELKSLFSAFGKTGTPLTLSWLAAEKSNLLAERNLLQNEIEQAERAIYQSAEKDTLTLTSQNNAYKEVQDLQARLLAATSERDATIVSVADSESFIRSLNAKVAALTDAFSVAEYFGDIRFSSCPACYAPVEEQIAPAHGCHLCKAPFNSDEARSRLTGLINETALQLQQSERLQNRRKEKLQALSVLTLNVESQWQEAAQRLSASQRLPSSNERQRLRDLFQKSGYLDRRMEDLSRQGEIIQLIASKSDQKNKLNDEITQLKSANQALVASQEKRLTVAYTTISDEIKELLKSDLRRQDIFEFPESVNFTFGNNKISVNGESYFSASSRAILKSSFYVGFLAAAMKTPFFRHPRFCMIDTLENMGVEVIRSHNFQLQIARISAGSSVEHQIIFATAMIEPSLDEEGIVVGRYYTLDNPTLEMSGKA